MIQSEDSLSVGWQHFLLGHKLPSDMVGHYRLTLIGHSSGVQLDCSYNGAFLSHIHPASPSCRMESATTLLPVAVEE